MIYMIDMNVMDIHIIYERDTNMNVKVIRT